MRLVNDSIVHELRLVLGCGEDDTGSRSSRRRGVANVFFITVLVVLLCLVIDLLVIKLSIFFLEECHWGIEHHQRQIFSVIITATVLLSCVSPLQARVQPLCSGLLRKLRSLAQGWSILQLSSFNAATWLF